MNSDSSAKFIGSLTKFLQSLCNGYVEFQKGVELVGHIYLSIDTGEKVDYILHEKVNKSDENSVTFVSNSFHAYPPDKEKNKGKDALPKTSSGKSVTSDDDDIVIIDSGNKGIPGSTNSGTIPSRKRMSSPGSDHHPNLKQARSSNFVSSRQHLGGPSSTISSQEGLNVGEMKLEQISSDELLSLASQVGEGQSRSSMSHSRNLRPGTSVSASGDAPSWIKQEAPDDAGGDSDTGWSQGRDESNSNSGSNLYPVMLHQNTSTYSNPVFPGAAPSYSNPVPGTSQDLGGLDPSVSVADWKRREYWRQYRLRQKMDPARYQRVREQAKVRKRRQTERRRQIRGQHREQQEPHHHYHQRGHHRCQRAPHSYEESHCQRDPVLDLIQQGIEQARYPVGDDEPSLRLQYIQSSELSQPVFPEPVRK